MRFERAALRAKAARTGHGERYIASVLASATDVTATDYHLTAEEVARLRAAWPDNGRPAQMRGLGDVVSPGPLRWPRIALQPGDMLAGLIRARGFKMLVGCGCHSFCQQMNQWGWWGCWRRRQEIYDWLALKAAMQGIALTQAAFWPLFRAAMASARHPPRLGVHTADAPRDHTQGGHAPS